MENSIYAQLVRLGDSEECLITGSRNDWYSIKQSEGGDGAEMARVFEDVKQPNHQSPALLHANCEVIGSCIYVIGGISIKSGPPYYVDEGSNMIYFIDTRNPKDGWRTCCTLPFIISYCQSAVVDDEWLYMLGGSRIYETYVGPIWGYAVNVNDSKQVRTINPPGNSPTVPIFAAGLSPGTLVACVEDKNTWYQLDCKNSTWTVYLEDSPFPSRWLMSCVRVVHDGILYIYDTDSRKLTSYDIRNKKELYEVDLPKSPCFPRQIFVEFAVLSKNRFCFMWNLRAGVGKFRVCYTRFSVSGHLPQPTLDSKEMQIFPVVAHTLRNIVTVDPHPDDSSSSSSE